MQSPKEILLEQSQIWQQVKSYLLERMKELLEAMIEGERDQYIQEKGGRRNGYWKRSSQAELGKIDELRVATLQQGWILSICSSALCPPRSGAGQTYNRAL